MTTTIQRARTAPEETPAPPPGPLPRMRRRPAVATAALAAAVLGAVAIGWVWSSSNDATEVLVATHDVPRGAVIRAGDLGTARITADPNLKPLPASAAGTVVGQRAATDLTAGSLVTAPMLEEQAVPAAGQSLVPVPLPAEQALGLGLEVGDHVRVVMTPGDGQPAAGNPAFTTAEVAAVVPSNDTGATVVSLTVPTTDAAVLAARVASGDFYVVLDSREVN